MIPSPERLRSTSPPAAPLRVQALGAFRVWRDDEEVGAEAWNREKSVQLFQFLVTFRRRRHLHKEEIADRLWPELDAETGDRDFKVALNALLKTLEPDRPSRSSPRFITRSDLSYGLHLDDIWIDADAFEHHVTAGNRLVDEHPDNALTEYRTAIALYQGDYLPARRYEDWCSAERERLQTLALATMTTLADLLVETQPLESLRLTEHVLAMDDVWENAYRTQMRAYLALGNRPVALRTYQRCVRTLEATFGVAPLPETQALHAEIVAA